MTVIEMNAEHIKGKFSKGIINEIQRNSLHT